MKYIEIMQKEMKEVLEQLKPHFKGEKVYIKGNNNTVISGSKITINSVEENDD